MSETSTESKVEWIKRQLAAAGTAREAALAQRDAFAAMVDEADGLIEVLRTSLAEFERPAPRDSRRERQDERFADRIRKVGLLNLGLREARDAVIAADRIAALAEDWVRSIRPGARVKITNEGSSRFEHYGDISAVRPGHDLPVSVRFNDGKVLGFAMDELVVVR